MRKKKRQPSTRRWQMREALEPSRALYEEGLTGMDRSFAVHESREAAGGQRRSAGGAKKEKAELYEQLSEVNRRSGRNGKAEALLGICQQTPVMEQDIQKQKNTRRRCGNMNIGGGEAADQLVRMMLSGSEVAVRLSGLPSKICWRSPWRWRKTTRPFPVKSIWSRC